MRSVRILGAGVGGLTAAITLRNKGYMPTIFEKKDVLGGNFKTSITGILNYDNHFRNDTLDFFKNEIDLNINKSCHPIFKLTRYSFQNDFYTVTSEDKPIIYNFLRGNVDNTLERELYDQCVRKEIKIEFGSRLKESETDIIATGSKHADFLGYGIHISYEDSIPIDKNEVKVFFDNSFAPGGYGYMLPFGSKDLTIAIFAKADRVLGSLSDYFKIFIEKLEFLELYNSSIGNIISIDSGYGFFNQYSTYSPEGKLYVGARAGLMTADYGFGLKESIISGYLAGLNIENHSNYDREIKRYLFPSLDESIFKRYSLDRTNDETLSEKIKSKTNKIFIEKTPSRIQRWLLRIFAKLYFFKKSRVYSLNQSK